MGGVGCGFTKGVSRLCSNIAIDDFGSFSFIPIDRGGCVFGKDDCSVSRGFVLADNDFGNFSFELIGRCGCAYCLPI